MRPRSARKSLIILSVLLGVMLVGWTVTTPLKFYVLGVILGFLAFRAWPKN